MVAQTDLAHRWTVEQAIERLATHSDGRLPATHPPVALTVFDVSARSSDALAKAEALADHVACSPTLVTLDLSGNKFGCAGVRPFAGALAAGARLTALDLAFTETADEGVAF